VVFESLRGALVTVLILGAGALLALALVSWVGPQRRIGLSGEERTPDRPVFAPIVEKILPGVVSIDVEKRFRHSDFGMEGEGLWGDINPDFPDQEFEIPSSGSGFVIDEQGHIITNDHVVRDGIRIDVHFSGGKTLPGRLVGRDPMTDIAVVQVDSETPLPTVPLGDSDDLRIGDWVIAIGNPLGMLEGSVTAGIVSAKGRTELAISGGSPTYQDFIQTDASINPGNSGGPLVNERGEAVGVNTAYNAPGGGIGFAIAIDMARSVAEQLIRSGRVPRAFMGVDLATLDRDLAEGWGLKDVQGVVVTEVQAGTPADQAGLRDGDVIIEFDGTKVTQVAPFRLLVARSEVGRKVRVRFLREGRARECIVELSERVDPIPQMPDPLERTPVENLGLIFSPFTVEEGDGVRVDSVLTDSPAYRAGIRGGDLVLQAGWDPVRSASELRRTIERSVEERGVVVLKVERGDSRAFLAVRSR
jgi:Do/DeqQ family serine protease